MMSETRLPAPEAHRGALVARHSGYLPLPFPSSPGDTVRCPGASGGYEPAPGTADVAAGLCGAAQLSATTLFGGGRRCCPSWLHHGDHLPASALWLHLPARRAAALLRWRASLAFFLTDEMFAVALKERERSGAFNPAYALIAGFVFYLFWNLATLLGIAAGQYIEGWTRWDWICHRRHLYRHDAPRHEEPAHGGGHPGERRDGARHRRCWRRSTSSSRPWPAWWWLCAASDKEVIMGWLMIGLLALITFFNRFAFFSRLTRYQPAGAEMGAFSSASRPSRC